MSTTLCNGLKYTLSIWFMLSCGFGMVIYYSSFEECPPFIGTIFIVLGFFGFCSWAIVIGFMKNYTLIVAELLYSLCKERFKVTKNFFKVIHQYNEIRKVINYTNTSIVFNFARIRFGKILKNGYSTN